MAEVIINGGEAQEKRSSSEGYEVLLCSGERPARSPLTSAEAFLMAAICFKEQVPEGTAPRLLRSLLASFFYFYSEQRPSLSEL